MYAIKTRKNSFAGVLLAGVLAMSLLSGCGYTLVSTDSLNQEDELPPAEETGQTQAEQLQNQLIAVLNLDRQPNDRILSSTSLNEASSLFLEIVLENPEWYTSTQEGAQSLKGMMTKLTNIYVYDGARSSASVGNEVIPCLNQDIAGMKKKYLKLYSLSVAYGESSEGSAWVILTQYMNMEETETDIDSGSGSE